MHTLDQGLKSLIATETMDGDNQWFCDELGTKARLSARDEEPTFVLL